MEKSVKPDKKLFTKIIWVQLTVTVFVLIAISLVQLIVNLAEGEQEAMNIVWIVFGIATLLMWIISTIVSKYWINNLEYLVCENRVIIHKGILTKTQQNIPFHAITDFALERTLFDRFLGMGSIKIQTAGQSKTPTGYEGKLSGLVEYEKWHSELREKIKMINPANKTLAKAETDCGDNEKIFEQILDELKEIRKNTSNK